MTKIDFSIQNKNAANSFHAQKKMLKRVMAGENITCQHCQGTLTLIPVKDGIAFVRCKKQCTNVELEVE